MGVRKKLTYEETKEKLPKERLEQLLLNKTYREIAREYNADERIVSSIAQKDYGIQKNRKVIGVAKNRDRIFNISKEELQDLYINQEKSARQIAEKYSTTHRTIIKKLKDYEIEVRPFNHEFYYHNRNYKHAKYIDACGYYAISINGETIREHRYIMEQCLNRKLTEDETVHHIDFNKLNNNISNLFLFEKQRYHTIYHKFINSHEYIAPNDFISKYKHVIDIIYNPSFLYNLYVDYKYSANAIQKYINDNYGFDLDRGTIVKILKANGIYTELPPTVNQYDDRVCINNI